MNVSEVVGFKLGRAVQHRTNAEGCTCQQLLITSLCGQDQAEDWLLILFAILTIPGYLVASLISRKEASTSHCLQNGQARWPCRTVKPLTAPHARLPRLKSRRWLRSMEESSGLSASIHIDTVCACSLVLW